jgi:hypothetical protein
MWIISCMTPFSLSALFGISYSEIATTVSRAVLSGLNGQLSAWNYAAFKISTLALASLAVEKMLIYFIELLQECSLSTSHVIRALIFHDTVSRWLYQGCGVDRNSSCISFKEPKWGYAVHLSRTSNISLDFLSNSASQLIKKKRNSMVWVRERPPLVGEVIANFCG